MRNLFLPIVAFIAIVIIAGCSTKFNIGAPYKNITVVYGFLDEGDTAHYIRIQKAFLDQSKSAITMSQTPDSSFYANINVEVHRINVLTGISYPSDTIHLNRVDLDLEGYPKQPGTFFTSPNYAYKFKSQLDPNYIYRLMITNLSTGETDSANAQVIDTSKAAFTITQLDVTAANLTALDFANSGINQQISIDGSYTPTNGQTSPVAIVQAVLTFNWYDSNVTTKTLTPHSYAYNLGYSYTTQNIMYSPLDLALYQGLYAGMGVAPANTYRLLDRCDLTVYASTSDFSSYQQAALTAGTGLTGSEIEPTFTNIMGANVLGLYTSRGNRTGKITITSDTIDSLIASPYLAPANIAGTIY